MGVLSNQLAFVCVAMWFGLLPLSSDGCPPDDFHSSHPATSACRFELSTVELSLWPHGPEMALHSATGGFSTEEVLGNGQRIVSQWTANTLGYKVPLVQW
jgi:hypothetical protein